MRHLQISLCIILILVTFTPHWAITSGLRDVQDGWLIPTRDAVHLLRMQSSDVLLPVTPGKPAGVWGIAGTMQMFSMPELPVKLVGMGIRLGGENTSWVINGQWQRTGGDLFLSDLQNLTLGLEKKGSVRIGLERRSLSLGSEPLPSWIGTKLLWELPPVQVSNCLLRSEIIFPLWASGNWSDHAVRQSRIRFGFFWDSYAVAGAFDKKSNLGWALGLELSTVLAHGIGLTVRVDPDTGSLGPGALFAWGQMLLRTSHVVHPELGITHRVTLTTGALESVPW